MSSNLRATTVSKRHDNVNKIKTKQRLASAPSQLLNQACSTPTSTIVSCEQSELYQDKHDNSPVHCDQNKTPPSNIQSSADQHSHCDFHEQIQALETKLKEFITSNTTNIIAAFKKEIIILQDEIRLLKEEKDAVKASIHALNLNSAQTESTQAAPEVCVTSECQLRNDTHTAVSRSKSTDRVERTPSIYPIDVHISNRFQGLSEDSPATGQESQSQAATTTTTRRQQRTQQDHKHETSHSDQWQQQPKRSRQQREITIEDSTSHVIIGDSLLKGIYSDRMSSSDSETTTIFPLPGADIDRLTATLRKFKNEEYVQELQRDAEKFRETLNSGTEDMQFACESCDRMWWKRVPTRKQVSKCYRCRIKYDAIPKEHQWGYGQFECPMGHIFRGFGIMGRTKSKCYRCNMSTEAELMFIIPPKKRDEDMERPRRNTHNCNGINCYHPAGQYNFGANDKIPVCIHPRSSTPGEPLRIHWASTVHESTGSTFVTILDQGSLDTDEHRPARSLETISEEEDG